MTQIEPSKPPSSLLPWILMAIAIVGLSAGLAFAATTSAGGAVMAGAAVLAGIGLGWFAAKSNPVVVPDPLSQTLYDDAGKADASMLSSRFARSAVEATPNPVVILDQKGRVMMSNSAARARFGLSSSRLAFASVVRRPDLIDAIETVFATRQSATLLMESRMPVDRYERASLAGFEAGGATFVLVSIADDTEVRMSERMRADFLANASHELRTPLAAIIGFIETLRGPAKDDAAARDTFLEVMHAQADRMSRLISDLLSLSRIEINEHVAPTAHSDLAACVTKATELLPPKLRTRLRLVAPKAPIWVFGDADEMSQVVINLIDNALKYSPADSQVTLSLEGGLGREAAIGFGMRRWEDGARLSLTSPTLEKDRLYGVLRIENLGEGIDRQYLPRLSERFFRVEDSASGKSGTGLGLAIVKHIISRHRGGLMVESELGRGAAFSVYLPQPSPEDAVSAKP